MNMKRALEVRTGNLQYSERKKRVKVAHYPWKKTAIGRTALMVIYEIVNTQMTHHQLAHEGKYHLHGVTKEFLTEELEKLYPQVFEHHFALLGYHLTMGKIYNRFHKMWYINGKPVQPDVSKGGLCQSREHPEGHPKLQQLIEISHSMMKKHKFETMSTQLVKKFNDNLAQPSTKTKRSEEV